jgi:hypothetical protein
VRSVYVFVFNAHGPAIAAGVVRTVGGAVRIDSYRAGMARKRTLCRDRAHIMTACGQRREYVGAGILFEFERIACVREGLAE